MKIAIIGSGMVGSALGQAFNKAGHEVVYGVRDPAAGPIGGIPIPIRSVRESANWGETILLAIPFAAAESVLGECGDLTGKIVIDATNPLAMSEHGLSLTVGFDDSGAEQISKFTSGAKVVKCFNQTGFGNMTDPQGSMMFVCGDDAAANETVRQLAEDIGFDAIAIGDLAKARLLEPLAMLWIHLGFTTDLKRDFAFRIDRR